MQRRTMGFLRNGETWVDQAQLVIIKGIERNDNMFVKQQGWRRCVWVLWLISMGLCLWEAVHVVSYFVHEDDVATGDRLETRQPWMAERAFGFFGLFWCHSRMTTGSF